MKKYITKYQRLIIYVFHMILYISMLNISLYLINYSKIQTLYLRMILECMVDIHFNLFIIKKAIYYCEFNH